MTASLPSNKLSELRPSCNHDRFCLHSQGVSSTIVAIYAVVAGPGAATGYKIKWRGVIGFREPLLKGIKQRNGEVRIAWS